MGRRFGQLWSVTNIVADSSIFHAIVVSLVQCNLLRRGLVHNHDDTPTSGIDSESAVEKIFGHISTQPLVLSLLSNFFCACHQDEDSLITSLFTACFTTY